MITIFETRYHGPTDYNGSRIRVTNTRTGRSRVHQWDYAVNGGTEQHEHAVQECSAEILRVIRYGGETKHGYLFVGISGHDEILGG